MQINNGASGFRVIKVGGAQLNEPARVDRLVKYVRDVSRQERAVAIVHGGGCEIGALHDQLGIPFEQKFGLRTTSSRSMEIVTMVLCGLVNKRLVARLVEANLPAIGISGVDLGLLEADYIDRERLGFVGSSPRVAAKHLQRLLNSGLIPVIAPVSMARDGALLNVNADVAAQAISVGMGARCLEFVTDVEGLRSARGVEQRVVASTLRQLLASETITGGMIPKVQAAMAAVEGGVPRVRMGSYDTLMRGTATEVHA